MDPYGYATQHPTCEAGRGVRVTVFLAYTCHSLCLVIPSRKSVGVMSGLDPEFGIKMMEVKVTEINVLLS